MIDFIESKRHVVMEAVVGILFKIEYPLLRLIGVKGLVEFQEVLFEEPNGFLEDDQLDFLVGVQ